MKKRIISLLLAVAMLAGTLLAIGTSAAEEDTGYPDVPSTRWSAESIVYMTEKGMMNDTGSGKFEPTKTVTRAMVVTVLYRMAGSPTVTKTATFTDVEDGKWYTDAVIWGAKNEIVTGFSDNTFRPVDSVTREQLVTFIGRYADMNYIILNGTDLSSYTDSGKIKDYALDYFKWAVNVGLVNGVTDTEIRPTAGATREQFAAIMHRYDTCESFDYELVYSEPVPLSTYTEPDYPLQDDADLFVSPDGDDSNPGTKDKPLATMEGARKAVLELKKTKTGDIKVAFMAGVYTNTNVTFTSEDSGNGGTITYCAYGDGDVEFNNGLVLDASDFEELNDDDRAILLDKFEDDIKKYDLSSYVSAEDVMAIGVFNDGEAMVTARYPNRDMSSAADTYISGIAEYVSGRQMSLANAAYLTKRLNNYHTYENLYIYGYLNWDFYCENGIVTNYDPETGIITLDHINGMSEDADNNGYWPDKPFVIVNASEELNAKGEYYVEASTMTLYVYDPEGEYEIAYNTEEFIRVEDAEGLVFRGIDFSCGAGDEILYNTEWPYASTKVYTRTDVEILLRNSSAIYTDTAAKNITFDLCSFSKMSNVYVLFLDGYKISLTNSEIYELYGGAVYSDCGDQDAYDNLTNMEKLIDNNYIHDNGLKYCTYKQGIYSHDVGGTISHNELYNLTHFAIEPVGVETVIEYNYIHNCNQIGDGGAIYTGKCHTRVGNVIRYNIFAENPGGFHIYLDDGLSGITIYGNVFFNGENTSPTAIRMSGGRHVDIHENVIIVTNHIDYGKLMDIWAKYYDMAVIGNDLDQSPTWLQWQIFNEWPTEGSAGEAIWKEKYPWLFEIGYDTANWRDPERQADPNYFINPDQDTIKNNLAFVAEVAPAEEYHFYFSNERIAELGTVENNVIFRNTTNPLFVNPTVGNYSIRDDVDTSVVSVIPDIPYAKIGRY